MFNMKQFMDKLSEVYLNNDEDYFYVGYIIAYDDTFTMMKTVDKKGCFSSFQLFKTDQITKIDSGSRYLYSVKQYIKLSKELGVYDSMDLENSLDILLEDSNSSLLEMSIKISHDDKQLVVFTLEEDDDLYYGYLSEVNEEFVTLSPIDNYSLREFEDIEIQYSEIDTFELHGVELSYIDYAYKSL
ncbi:MAG: hypothetical protein GXZ08_09115 [Tissierellia bacterium]|nr:hypothetical protein [Tissierellia bacterium]